MHRPLLTLTHTSVGAANVWTDLYALCVYCVSTHRVKASWAMFVSACMFFIIAVLCKETALTAVGLFVLEVSVSKDILGTY